MSFKVVFDALDPNTLIECRFSLDGTTPSQIDPANDSGGVDFATLTGQMVSYAGKLFIVLRLPNASVAAHNINVFMSSDGGATWAVQDTANAPTSDVNTGGIHSPAPPATLFDGDHSLVVLYQTGNSPAPWQLINFDLDALTWGATYGALPTPTSSTGRALPLVLLFTARPDGTWLAIFGFNGDNGSGQQLQSFMRVWDGASWSSPATDFYTNVEALPSYTADALEIGAYTMAVDTTGIVHVFFNVRTNFGAPPTPPFWDNRCFYQQILPDNSLGLFLDFPGQNVAFNSQTLRVPSNGGSPLGLPVIVVDSIVVPTLTVFTVGPLHIPVPSVYVGTPVSAPAWSLLSGASGGIDPEVLVDADYEPETMLAAAFDGASISVVWVNNPTSVDIGLSAIRNSVTSDLADPSSGWVASTLYDETVDGPPSFFPAPPAPDRNSQFLAIPQITALGSVPPPPPPPSVKITFRGVKRRRCGAQDVREYHPPKRGDVERAM